MLIARRNERPGDRILRVAGVALAQRDPRGAYRHYLAALGKAVAEQPPPFGMNAYAETYHDASEQGEWLAISLIANAQREGDGARRLWSLAANAAEPTAFNPLKRHAVDESHHALAYLTLLDLTFPGALAPKFRVDLEQLSPRFAIADQVVAVAGSPYAHAPTVDDYIQMNIAEIRTTIHHTLQRSAITRHCPPANFARAGRILDSLLRDELSHVAYTARLIEAAAASLPASIVPDLMCRRLCDFNRITTAELARSEFSTCVTCAQPL